MKATVALTVLAIFSAGAETGGGHAQTRPAGAHDPEAFWVEMTSGEVLTGRLRAQRLIVRTASGEVTVRVGELVSFTIGLDARPEPARRIDGLIRDLGAEEYAKREAAQAALIGMGPALRPILAEHVNDRDLERAVRVAHILQAYSTWEADHPDAPPSALMPMRRQTLVRTASGELVGPIRPERLGIIVAGKTVELAVPDIHRAVKVGSKPDLEACLIHGRAEGLRTDFVKDVPEPVAARHRRVTRTANTFGSVASRHDTSRWLYAFKGKGEVPRVLVEDGKKYYPIWGTWRQRWRGGWVHLDENGAQIKGPPNKTHPHHESKVDYYVVPLKPPAKP